jgi:Cu(I)/Ag(I) efflux system membrane fusion protein
MNTEHTEHTEHALPEGDEHPPAGVRAMGVVRWLLIACLGGLAAFSVAREYGAFHGQVAHALYQCPMHPEIIADHPSNCPICGMALVRVETPVKAAEGIVLDDAARSRIGLKLSSVALRTLSPSLTALGSVEVDEARVSRVHARSAGFVERLDVAETYARVAAGAPLLGLYSPDVVLAQEEWLALTHSGERPSLTARAREKLLRLGVAQVDLDGIAQRDSVERLVPVRAPTAGLVTRKEVVRGSSVEAGALLFELTDLSQVWVVAEISASDAQSLRPGMQAEVLLGGETSPRRATLDRIYPEMESARRSVRIRLRLPNPELHARPGQSARVIVRPEAVAHPAVPESAVLRLGNGSYVFVSGPDHALERRRVDTGAVADGFVAVVQGLREGERVVSAASFLVDSETRLSRLGEEATGAAQDDAGAAQADGGAAP